MTHAKFSSSIFLIVFFIIFFPLVNASVEDLVASYDFYFNLDSSLVVTNQTDYMLDSDNDGVLDKLFFDLAINVGLEGTYYFYIDVEDNGKIIPIKITKEVFLDTKIVSLNMSTDILLSSQFNYSIKVYNEDDILVFRKFRQQTENYLAYETNFKVLEISDKNINNDFVRIYLAINSTKKVTGNVTVFLKYNDFFIQSTKEIKFDLGQNSIHLDVWDWIIKNTHYVGEYKLDKLIIGEKIINLTYTTSEYNFEDFAKTSYFKFYNDGVTDLDNNGLIDYLKIDFTLDIKQQGNYKIEYQLYDLFGNFVVSSIKEEFLNEGTNIVETQINGSEIYKSKRDPQYIIKFASLKNSSGDLIDERINPYALKTQNISYLEFEKSFLPDLTIDMEVVYEDLNNLIRVTVSNLGNSPAFGIFIDVFDNKTYYDQISFFMLEMNKSETFTFTANNTANNSFFTAVVDFDNLIDELNETNNVVDNFEFFEEIIVPNDTRKFYIRNIFGESVAWFGNFGNIILKGKCIVLNKCVPPKDSFIIANKTDSSTAYIDNLGNLCIEKGNCGDKSLTCNPARDAFIIRNASDDNMSYIDFGGNLCLTGKLFENSEINL